MASSSTASPLPPPQQVQLAPVDMMLMAAANATNGTHPGVVAGVASSASNANDAVAASQAAAQLSNVQDTIEQLKGQTPAIQQQTWDGLSAAQQAQFRSAGYKPPAPHRSLWGDVTHAAGEVFSHTVGSQGVSDVLNDLGAPLRAVQHGERTLLAMADTAQMQQGDTSGASATQGNNLGKGLAEWGDLFKSLGSVKDWSKAWNETESGQSYILPSVKQQALQKYGQNTYNLALSLAEGKSVQDLINAVPQAQQQTLMGQIQSKNTQDALALLNAGHASVGRMAVGAGFIARHPDAGAAMSGALDGTMDWFGDPLNIAGGAYGEYKATAYLANSADGVQKLYDGSSSVRNAMQDIAQRVAAGDFNGPNGLFTRYSKLKQAAQDLVAAKADTEQKVLDYFKSVADAKDVMSGSPSNAISEFSQQMPHLTKLGEARLAAKGQMQRTVDWAAERIPTFDTQPGDLAATPGKMDKIAYPAGRFLRAATTLVPQQKFLVLNSPDAAHVLNDIGLQFLPRRTVNEFVAKFLDDPNPNNRMKVYRSMMLQMGKAAGLDQDPDFWENYYSKFTTGNHLYGHGDEMTVDGAKDHYAITKNQLAEAVAIPDYRKIYLQARKGAVTQTLTKGMNVGFLDKFMGVWRPLTLAHLGFATRVGGEEAFAFMLRHSPVDYLRASAARTLTKAATRRAGTAADATLADATDEKAADVWDRMTGHLPAKAKDGVQNLRDMFHLYFADQTKRAVESMAGKLAGPKYEAAAEELARRGWFDPGGGFDVYHLTANHGYDAHEAGDINPQEMVQVRDGSQLAAAQIAPTDDYQEYKQTDPLYLHMYSSRLHQMASDDWGYEALKPGPASLNKGAQYAIRVRRVADKLEADPVWQGQSLRAVQDRSDRQVGTQITRRQAAEDHARVLIKNADHLVQRWVKDDSEAGGHFEDIPGLRDHMLREGKPPTLAALNEIPIADMPHTVTGPAMEYVKVGKGGIVQRATNKLFSKYIGPQINWISRQPMFLHEYTVAREKYLASYAQRWRAAGHSEDTIADMIHENARDQAIKNTIQYVHNPQLRSEMSTITRNLAPFWFAQEQFYKRWARTFAYSPAAFRQAQLLSQGLRHSGLIHTNPEDGQEYFVYPGSGLVQQTLVDTLSHFGVNAQVPVEAGLTGQVNMLNPAIQRIGAPNFGPVVVVPLNGLKTLDPHMTQAINSIEGSVASQSGFLKAILPTTLTRTLEVAYPNAINASQYASAQMQAIQALEATGHGLGTPATTQVASKSVPHPQPGDYVLDGSDSYVYQPNGTWQLNNQFTLQKYLTRIQNWARIFMFTRLIYGFAAPAAPEDQFNPGNLHNDLQTLMNDMPVDQALTTFLAEHPDASAETVFQTQSQGGTFLPATKSAMQFLDNNPSLVSQHPLAAAYFIPQQDTTGKFDLNAYEEQLAEGLRVRKSPEQFYQEVVYNAAAQDYYKMETYKNQLLAAHSIPETQLNDQWTQWSEQFMQANPIFASLYGTGSTGSTLAGSAGAGELGRQQVMDDVASAVNDGTAPQNAQTSTLKLLYESWSAWQELTNTYGDPNQPSVNTGIRDHYDQQYAQFLQQFEQEFPSSQAIIQRAIAPDLTYAMDQLASQGVTVTL